MVDVGDVSLSNDWQNSFATIERVIKKLLSEGHHPVSFGGSGGGDEYGGGYGGGQRSGGGWSSSD